MQPFEQLEPFEREEQKQKKFLKLLNCLLGFEDDLVEGALRDVVDLVGLTPVFDVTVFYICDDDLFFGYTQTR